MLAFSTMLCAQTGRVVQDSQPHLAKPAKATSLKVITGDGQDINPTDYGTKVSIMTEDFEKLSTGSVGAPDLTVNTVKDSYEYPWINMKDEYTNMPGWGCYNLYPAGGTACIYGVNGGGKINTPMLNLKNYDGIAFIKFKARTEQGKTCDVAGIEAAETYNMSPTWTVLGSEFIPQITDEWKEFEFMYKGAGEYTLFNIYVQGQGSDNIYFDDMEVYQIDQFVSTPACLKHTNYTGNGELASFNANWTKSEGAEYYTLDVYSYSDTEEVEYLLMDQQVNDTTFMVTTAESGKTYYYTVRAHKDGHTSFDSAPMEVADIAAPVLNDNATIENGKYTATWEAVPTAERYNYYALYERTAQQDGEFIVTDEDFTGVKDGDGNLTGWTLENPSYMSYGEFFIKDMNQAGWKGTHYAPYTDYICLDAWFYIYGGGDAGLISPQLDLSKDNGNINLSVDLWGEFSEGVQTRCAVALFNYDETIEDYVQAELVYADGVAQEWKNFNIALTKGTSRSIIGLYAVTGPGNLYIDNLKITQNYQAGETFLDPFLDQHYYDNTSLEVSLPSKVAQCNIYHKATAVKSASNGVKESKFSETKLVGLATTTGIGESVSLKNAAVQIHDGNIFVANPQGLPVSVYNVNGIQVYSNNTGAANQTVKMSANGVYIVKVGNQTVRVAAN